MSVELKPHNLGAYDRVKRKFENTDRAAVIHPTGTGKSFIALKLVEENQDKKVIYLSPSLPIMIQFKKNMIANGISVRNVERISYQKLTSLFKNNALNLQADIIILDEFHHCGAPEWGKAVRELLNQNGNAKILGLSATPVRYLDDEVRDMAEEIFDDNIASEMSLGEAITAGILREPIYTAGLYEYVQITSELEEKIAKCSDPERKKIAQAELEKLRERLQASVNGLPELLENAMTNKSGRYIVYCKDIADMEKKMQEASQLFGRVNPNMEIMSISSRDEDIRKDETTIRNFEKEIDDKKLKLLFSVNMLNEGYHLNKLDGVIMMRPTHSPTLYYQQLGRALSVGNDRQPIVIDLVNNIDTIEIMEGFSKSLGEAEARSSHESTTRFSISEEIREIRKIVEKIDGLVARRSLSNEEKLRLMTEYMNETGEKIVFGTIYKGYNLGSIRNNLRSEYYKGALKIDEDLLKAFISAGIILEEKERVRTSIQEKYDFLVSTIGKSPEEREDMVMRNGLSYSEARSWLQTQYNRGSLNLTEDQIDFLRTNGILNMSKQERANLEKKYESLLKYGIDVKTLLAIEKEYGSFEEFMDKFKKVEINSHLTFDFEGFRGITVSSREITEREKLGYAKIVSEIGRRPWRADPESTRTIGYNSGWYIDMDEFDKEYGLLDSGERKALAMYYGLDGTSYTEREIAQALGGLSEHRVSKKLNYAILKLSKAKRKYLKESRDIDETLKTNQEKRQAVEEKLRKMRERIINENGKQKVRLSVEDLENFDEIRNEFKNMFGVIINEDGRIEDVLVDPQKKKELEEICFELVEELDLSARAKTTLLRNQIDLVRKIIDVGPEEIKKLRGMGDKSYNEIIEKMQELGFEVKENDKGKIEFKYVKLEHGPFNEEELLKRYNEVIKDLTEELDSLNSERVVLEEEQSRYKRACEVYENAEDILDPEAIVPAIGRDEKLHTPNDDRAIAEGGKKTEETTSDRFDEVVGAVEATDLDTQIAENERASQEKQEQQRKELIDRIQKKRAIKREQEAEIAELYEERGTQISKDDQQH